MRNPITLIREIFEKDNKFKGYVENYQRVLNTDEWEFFRYMNGLMRADMRATLFTDRFTKLPAEEKDVQQRVYSEMFKILNFYDDPIGYIRKKRQLGKQLTGVTRR